MSMPQRLMLLLAAMLVGGYVTTMGSEFAHAVEPESFSIATIVFWLAAGALFSAPLWLPAVVPNRFSGALTLCRRISAALLVVHTCMFGAIVVHGVTRRISGYTVSHFAQLQGAVLFAACIFGIAILLWPDRKARTQSAP